MSTTQIVVLVVVIVVVLLLVGAVLAFMRRRTKVKEERREEAQSLREKAGTRTPQVQDALIQADQAEAEAGRLRARADDAEAEAARLRRGAAAEEAAQEDTVREADRLDPDVDTRAKDYTPAAGLGAPAPADPVLEETAPPDPLADPMAPEPTREIPTQPTQQTHGAHRGDPEAEPPR